MLGAYPGTQRPRATPFGKANPVSTAARVKDLVADLIAGCDVPAAWRRLGTSGQEGANALLDALEGKSGSAPRDRHPRDLHEDLVAGLQAIAHVDPGPLITALDLRPGHTFSLIWALGSSGEEAALRKLMDYAKHQDKWVRWAAVSGLARFRRKCVLRPLLDALRDRSDMIRFTALGGLAKVADRTAIEPLKRYLAGKTLQPGGRPIATELLENLERKGTFASSSESPDQDAQAERGRSAASREL
jgi:HEAT repeat protein